MNLNYPQIIARAISDGQDPVYEMHRWYRLACAYGATPPAPPKLTIDQSNDLRQFAAESNCTMSTLFDATIDTLLKGGSPTAAAAEAYKAHRSNNTPPTKATFNVYTKDQVIHNVPADKLEQMGPETLASVVAITDEIPWAPKRLELFKKAQAETIAEREAKKKMELEAGIKRALDVTEDLVKAAEQPYVRKIRIHTIGGLCFHTTLDKIWLIDDGYWFHTVEELVGEAWYDWPTTKVAGINQKRHEKAAVSKKAKRKEQIDELVSKLLKERNEL